MKPIGRGTIRATMCGASTGFVRTAADHKLTCDNSAGSHPQDLDTPNYVGLQPNTRYLDRTANCRYLVLCPINLAVFI